MAIVEVHRVSGGHSKRLNPFEVVIDEEIVGRLGPGESESFEVTPGPHGISAKIYWCRSEKVDVNLREDQKLIFRCETRAKNFISDGYWSSLGYRRYLRLSQVSSVKVRPAERGHGARESSVSRRPADAARGEVTLKGADRPLRLAGIMNSVRYRQPTAAAFLLLAVGIMLLALTWGLEFLTAVSIINIGVQAVYAVNFHLLAPRSAFAPGIKSHGPLRFRVAQETIVSAAFALAGIASLTGVLHAGSLAGWLAVGAAAAAAANVIATRRSAAVRSDKPPDATS